MDLVLDRILFSRKSEGIPATRMQDVKTLHTLHARINIARSVNTRVPGMQTLSRWIRKFIEYITLRLAPPVFCPVQT